MKATHFLVRSNKYPRLVLTVSGQFIDESLCGPGQRCAKLYKTARGAKASCGSSLITIHPCTELGIEK